MTTLNQMLSGELPGVVRKFNIEDPSIVIDSLLVVEDVDDHIHSTVFASRNRKVEDIYHIFYDVGLSAIRQSHFVRSDKWDYDDGMFHSFFSAGGRGKEYTENDLQVILQNINKSVVSEDTLTVNIGHIGENTDVSYKLNGHEFLHENMPVYEHWDPNQAPGSPEEYWTDDDTHKSGIFFLLEEHPYAFHLASEEKRTFDNYWRFEEYIETMEKNVGSEMS